MAFVGKQSKINIALAFLKLITVCNSSFGKVMFYRCLSVHRGEVYTPLGGHPPRQKPPRQRHPRADIPSGQTSPLGRHPLWADIPSGQTSPLGRHPLWADIPSGQTPPLGRPPRQTPPPPLADTSWQIPPGTACILVAVSSSTMCTSSVHCE